MSPENKFSAALREWTKVFMGRSMRDFRDFIRETGLSSTQLSTLMYLYYRGTSAMSNVGCYLGITNAASSQMVQKLVEQNLVARSEAPKDRRTKQLTLTGQGQTLIEAAIESRRRWLEELTTAFTSEEQANIITALTLLTESARELDPELSTNDE